MRKTYRGALVVPVGADTMPMTAASLVLIVCVSIFTAIAAVIDFRTRRIPNWLTLSAFGLGIVYQIACHWHEPVMLLDPLKAFGVGFGTLFVLWLIGGGGGGDVKLMGALSVWLGFEKTIGVLFLSTIFVLIGTGGVILWSILTRGFRGTRKQYVSKTITEAEKGQRRVEETVADRQKRRIMTYALPVALATWCVLAWVHLKPARENRARDQVHASR